MAERAMNLRRKSQLFLKNISPVTNTYDQLVRTKLEIGKFPLTKTGIIKITGMLVLIAGLALFLGQPVCKETSSWYPYLYSTSVGISILVQLTLFLLFSVGVTVENPWKWIKTDIFMNFIFSVVTIISATLTSIDCIEPGTVNKIPGPLGIVGGILSIVGCAGIFLLYRYNDEDDEAPRPNGAETTNPAHRKSIFA